MNIKPAVIIGTGPSLKEWAKAAETNEAPSIRNDARVLWGVNLVGNYIFVDHLVLLDAPESFKREDIATITASISEGLSQWTWIGDKYWDAWLSQHLAGLPRCVPFTSYAVEAGAVGLEWLRLSFRRGVVPVAHSSAYAALMLALRAGHREIELIGVDFLDHPILPAEAATMFDQACWMAQRAGVRITNLSEQSVLKVPRKEPWQPAVS